MDYTVEGGLMSWAGQRTFIEERLSDNWATTPISYSNVDYAPVANSSFIRLTVLGGDTIDASFSTSRSSGVVVMQVFTPSNIGSATALSYADSLAAIFEGVTSDEFVFGTASLEVVGAVENFFQVNVNIGFTEEG